jgi:hypothetical protein
MKPKDFLKKHFETSWCFITSLIILTFTTRSSFLFPYNNWDDANSYFTMGKGMMNGMVIYRDLYDQKGPFLYLLYGIGYLLSNKSFLGIYFLEIIAGTLFLFYAFKEIKRHSSSAIAAFITPVIAGCVYSSRSFYWGGAAEEFCLPMLSYSLYTLDVLLHPTSEAEKEKLFAPKTYLIVGFLTGLTALVKYTMLGFFFAWAIVCVVLIISRKNILHVFKPAACYILGIIIPVVPWLIYFGINNALDDWYRCYIYNNLFFYSNIATGAVTLYEKLYKLAKLQYWLTYDNLEYFVWIIACFILVPILEKKFFKKIVYIFIYISTFFVIFYGGGTLPYYSIPLMSIAIPGGAYISEILIKLFSNNQKKKIWCSISIFALAFSALFAKNNCLSSYYIFQDKETHWLTRMASQIENAPDTTLLNVGCLDVGLYTITGIVPTCEYFQTNGIALPTMFEEQKRYIDEGLTEYVIAGEEQPDGIYQKYELVDSVSFYDNSYDQNYYLYKLK